MLIRDFTELGRQEKNKGNIVSLDNSSRQFLAVFKKYFIWGEYLILLSKMPTFHIGVQGFDSLLWLLIPAFYNAEASGDGPCNLDPATHMGGLSPIALLLD